MSSSPVGRGKADGSPTATVVGMGGSLASKSGSLSALRIALAGAEEAGATTELLDLRTMDLPMYRPDAEPTAPVERFCDLTYSADGLLWSSPLYHGTVSGSFKNALDWLQVLAGRNPPYLTDKVIGLIAAAGGVQGLQAVNTMEFVVRALRGWAVPLVVPVAQAWRAFDDEGRVSDSAVEGQLRALGREVATVCLRRRGD
ncbi:MAG: NADPH-dependent FMN reductase [Acidimicrobiia bacterium]